MIRVGDRVIWFRVKTGYQTQKFEAEVIKLQPQRVRIKVLEDGREVSVERDSLKRVS